VLDVRRRREKPTDLFGAENNGKAARLAHRHDRVGKIAALQRNPEEEPERSGADVDGRHRRSDRRQPQLIPMDRPCQLKQPQREIRPGLTIGNHGDLCTGCNRSWCLKRKLDKARPADCGCPCQKTRGIERAPRDHSPTGDRREKRLFRHFCPRKMPSKPRFFGWFSAQNPARC